MLDWLFFEIGGFFQGHRYLIVYNHGGNLILDYFPLLPQYQGKTRPHYHAKWAKVRSERWLKEFVDMGCEAWQAHYTSDILDGTQWSLRYKFDGENEHRLSGSNAFPGNWNRFMEWMENTISSLPQATDATVKEVLEAITGHHLKTRGEEPI